MSFSKVFSPENRTTPGTLHHWVDEHPTGTVVVSALVGCAATWLSLKGVEILGNLDIPTTQEAVIILDGTAASAAAGALALKKALPQS